MSKRFKATDTKQPAVNSFFALFRNEEPKENPGLQGVTVIKEVNKPSSDVEENSILLFVPSIVF